MNENENETPAVESPNAELLTFLSETVVNLYLKVDPIVSGETWGTWSDTDKLAFRGTMAALAKVTTALRNAFDSPIWKGRITGVEPIRAESTRSKTAPTDSAAKLEALLKG